MNDRDTFAAAALTGFSSQLRYGSVFNLSLTAKQCYELADAMLRKRCRSGGDCLGQDNAPNLDAAPAARAGDAGAGDTQSFDAYRRFVGEVMNWISEATGFLHDDVLRTDDARDIITDACSRCWDAFDRIAYPTDHGASPEARASGDSDRADKAAPRPSEGTGDTPDSPQPIACSVFDRSQPIAKPTPVHTPPTHAAPGDGSVRREGTEPVAWGVANGSRVLATSISRMDAVDMQGDYAYHTEIVPLYREPPVTKPMPKEKRAEVCAGPLAWAAIRENGQPLWLSYDRSGAEGMVNGMAEVVPLYRQPTLTDAEREAVEFFAELPWAKESGNAAEAAVLRGLLERLK